MKASDGSLLGHLVKKVHGKGIAAFLGKPFRAAGPLSVPKSARKR
jgi:hypothetical protein